MVGCADGVIRVFQAEKLYYQATLPLPLSYLNQETSDSYAACLALTTVSGTHTAPCPKVASVYADHSMFVWDITDIQNVVKYRSFVYHRACIWDVQFISTADNPIFGPGTFVTCSADNSIRVWNTDPKSQRMSRWRSMYSKEMLHAIEIEDYPNAHTTANASAMADDVRRSDASSSSNNVSMNVSSISAAEAALNAGRTPTDICKGIPDTEIPDKPQSTAAPRALAVHPSGVEMVCGDRTGLLRFFNLGTMAEIKTSQAHSAEVLTLNYSPPLRPTGDEDGSWTVDYEDDEYNDDEDDDSQGAAAAGVGVGVGGGHPTRRSVNGHNKKSSSSAKKPLVLLASAGRDRLVHVLDASREYAPITTLDNHSSSVTTVKFTNDGRRLLR
jgi:WD40 repeat protein